MIPAHIAEALGWATAKLATCHNDADAEPIREWIDKLLDAANA